MKQSSTQTQSFASQIPWHHGSGPQFSPGLRTQRYPDGQCGLRFPPQESAVDVDEGVAVGVAEIQAPLQWPIAGHVTVGVQVDPVGQPGWPTVQGTWVLGGCVGMQRPPQTIVCVQKEPAGQSLAPTTQVCVGNWAGVVLLSGAVAMQRPPQAPLVGEAIVGVHVELGGHLVVALIVQGI